MLRPKLPAMPTVPVQHSHVPACSCQHPTAPTAVPSSTGGRQVTQYAGIGVGVVVAVIALCVVLTALLAAVAITAVAVSIAAMVLRSLLTKTNQR